MPNVTFVHPKVKRMLPLYELISDCLEGELQIKFKQDKYLPRPNPADISVENQHRYSQYIRRAVFYNVAQRTLAGLIGQVFLRSPDVKVPPALQPVVDDATGSGVPLEQLAQQAAAFAMASGRAGLYVDYPDVEGPTSIADIEAGRIRPTMKVVPPKDCINFRVKKRGAKIILSLVVFREDYIARDDGFETVVRDQWRVLRLNADDQYVIEIYTDKIGASFTTYMPVDAQGFIGSTTNDPEPDLPPMYDLCSLNIAHYRNSADYEENVYFIGQPTPWFSGLTEQWVKEVMGDKVGLGTRGAIVLPVGGAAGILQVQPNTLAKEAMEQKEAQMLALGAKLVEGSQTQRTATEADIDNTSETSILSTVAKNTAQAFKWGLEWAAAFVGVSEAGIEFNLNTEFDMVSMTAADRAQLLKEWQAGGIVWEEYRDNMRRAGVATLNDTEAKTKAAAEDGERLANAVKQAEALAPTNPAPGPAA
jgi:hypothetical protein